MSRRRDDYERSRWLRFRKWVDKGADLLADGIEIQVPDQDAVLPMEAYTEQEFRQTREKQETADITGQLDLVEKIVAIERKTKQDVEELFGEGTCRKVFGEILPSMDLFVEFFGSILPFFEEYKKERMRKMGKYGADRTGSSI